MRKDRLLKLADFLETVPRQSFNIGAWQSHAATKPEGKRPGDCGFAGCAVGWAVHTRMFRGFKFIDDGWGATPAYGRVQSWEAIGNLFGISHGDDRYYDQSEYLFMGSQYPAPHTPTPKQVAKRIRSFVASNGVVSE